MKGVQKNVKIPEELAQAVQEIAEQSGRDSSAVAKEMLEEGVKVPRHPGIYFGDGPTGRRAKIVGTSLDVWELISSYQAMDNDWDQLREAFNWLSEWHLRPALDYYAAYAEEIHERIARNEAWTPERVAKEYPGPSGPWTKEHHGIH